MMRARSYDSWLLHGTPGEPPPPRRPPAPTDVPLWLAPDGHALDVVRVSTGLSTGWVLPPSLELDAPRVWHVERNTARDGYRGVCECGEVLEVSAAYWTPGIPPAAHVIVGAWERHLVDADVLDRDELIVLRRALEDAESIARYGRPFHPRPSTEETDDE